MGGADQWQQQQIEQERHRALVAIIRKARMARKDGYFTEEDIKDMEREFGLSTRRIPNPNMETF